MAITFTYPIVEPKIDDLVLGTQTPDPLSSETDTPTRNFTIQSIVDLVSTTSFVTIGGSQTITGAKTFTTNIAAPNVGGDNTGDQSLSISGSVITISGTNSSVTVPSGGTGTVTSVGLSTDIAAFAVGFANPITTQGTITLNLNGGTSGQFLRQDGTWATVINGGAVASVNGATGTVVLNTGDIAEVTNLYYTEARVSANTNVAANTAKVGITTAQATDITNSVKNDTDTYTSTPPVTKIITLTQAEYTAITTPNVNTLYIII